jgi:hypothetical protein
MSSRTRLGVLTLLVGATAAMGVHPQEMPESRTFIFDEDAVPNPPLEKYREMVRASGKRLAQSDRFVVAVRWSGVPVPGLSTEKLQSEVASALRRGGLVVEEPGGGETPGIQKLALLFGYFLELDPLPLPSLPCVFGSAAWSARRDVLLEAAARLGEDLAGYRREAKRSEATDGKGGDIRE